MSKFFIWDKLPVGMMLFQHVFLFPEPISPSEIVSFDFLRGGCNNMNVILDWIDEVVKDTPFVNIELDRWIILDGKIKIIYKVYKRATINTQYMFRHLALQDYCKN